MELLAFPFQQRRRTICASLTDSAIMDARDPDSHGTSFVFYDCALCGQLVYRILQFYIANPDGDYRLLVERVESEEEIKAVIRATVGAP
jgi:hypothetical protein